MTHLSSALSRRLRTIRKNDEGFSLIELLVVVIIIGILAAIAIPIYIGVQDSAKDSAVKSDLTNAKTAVIAYATAHPDATSIPTTGTPLTMYGYAGHSDNVQPISFAGVNPSLDFCLQAVRVGGSAANTFHVNSNGNVSPGVC